MSDGPKAPPAFPPGPPAVRDEVLPRLIFQFGWYVLTIWGPIFSLVLLFLVNILFTIAAERPAPIWFNALLVLAGYLLAGWACTHWVKTNHNGVFGRLKHFIPHIAHPGLNFFHPRPIWRVLAQVPLDDQRFVPDAKDVDTGTYLDIYLPGEKSGTGQVDVEAEGSVIVTHPYLVARFGGMDKVLAQVNMAVVAAIRQYCAMRIYEWLKNDPYHEGEAVFSGRQPSFYAPVLTVNEDGQLAWTEEEQWIDISGFTLEAFLAGYGVAMFRFTVKDYTPSGAGLKEAQDLVALQERQMAAKRLVIDEFNRQMQELRTANPDASPNELAQIVAANLGLAEVKFHNFGSGTQQATPFVTT